MCEYYGGRNENWIAFPPDGPPLMHWINREPPSGPLCHYVFNLETKHLNVFCCDTYDIETGVCTGFKLVYSGPAPHQPWPTTGVPGSPD